MLVKKLYKEGVLGMNARNGDIMTKYNPRAFFPRVDSKIQFKQLCIDAGIPVPTLYDTFSFVGELKSINKRLSSRTSFVIKPEHGSGGEGVMILTRKGDEFTNSAGRLISIPEIRLYMADVLYGLYSLGGKPDRAMIEYKVQFDDVFKKISFRGVPDIRVIVFQGVPIMAMLRLPTEKSNGRANLHQGAIGVGIDIATGITRNGVQGSNTVYTHPDTKESISKVQIPRWEEVLQISAKAFDVVKLGYFGIDIVFDSEQGPMVLEANARPGLAIQLANEIGLRNRLKSVEENISALKTEANRLDFISEVAKVS